MPGARRVASDSASNHSATQPLSHSASSKAAPVIPNQQFPRRVRLTSSQDFTRALRKADIRRRVGPLRIMCRKNDMHFPRLGLIVGKRAVRNAAERNRIKRVIRDYFRRCQHELAEYDLVVQVMTDVNNEKLRMLLAEVVKVVGKTDDPVAKKP